MNPPHTGHGFHIVTRPSGYASSSNGGCLEEESNPCNGFSMKLTRNGEGTHTTGASNSPDQTCQNNKTLLFGASEKHRRPLLFRKTPPRPFPCVTLTTNRQTTQRGRKVGQFRILTGKREDPLDFACMGTSRRDQKSHHRQLPLSNWTRNKTGEGRSALSRSFTSLSPNYIP